jgi:hypothetical protein
LAKVFRRFEPTMAAGLAPKKLEMLSTTGSQKSAKPFLLSKAQPKNALITHPPIWNR